MYECTGYDMGFAGAKVQKRFELCAHLCAKIALHGSEWHIFIAWRRSEGRVGIVHVGHRSVGRRSCRLSVVLATIDGRRTVDDGFTGCWDVGIFLGILEAGVLIAEA